MPKPTTPSDTVELTLDNGRLLPVHAEIAERVRGIDADGDVLITMGEPGNPTLHDDGTEYLIALTRCCHASAKGSTSPRTPVVCRRCYSGVDSKYGGPGEIDVPVTRT